jgi:hypothetical protein
MRHLHNDLDMKSLLSPMVRSRLCGGRHGIDGERRNDWTCCAGTGRVYRNVRNCCDGRTCCIAVWRTLTVAQ